MQSTRSSIDWSKRIASTVLTTAIAATPFLHTLGAQAKPPSHAPAWGYRKDKKDKKHKNKDRDWRNDRDRDERDRDDRDYDDNDNLPTERTLTGTVVRDLAGDRFELRTDSGRIVTVRLRQEFEPRRLDRGDRVRVEGRFRSNGNFVATDLDILDNRNDNNDERTLTGTVVRDLRGDRFELRTDNGRLVTVQLRRENEPRRLNRGDRVRVEGEFRSNNVFVADDLDILRNNGGGNGGDWNRRVNFPATVVDVLSSTRLRVRGDNGRTYVVQSRTSLRNIDDGDRVRIVGDVRDGVVRVDNVVLVRNTNRRSTDIPGDILGDIFGR